MGIQRIMAKAINYVAKSGKTAARTVTRGGYKAPSILSKVETNTSGRILRMQDAKKAFTPVAPYATKVTKTNVPTQQFLDEMLEVGKVDGLKAAKGIYNRTAAADALAAFKNEPVKLAGGKLGVTSVPTQQYLDDMLGIAKTDALKAYEQGGRATREILDARQAAREAFTNGNKPVSRLTLKFNKFFSTKYPKKLAELGNTKMITSEWNKIVDDNAFKKLIKKA